MSEIEPGERDALLRANCGDAQHWRPLVARGNWDNVACRDFTAGYDRVGRVLMVSRTDFVAKLGELKKKEEKERISGF